MSITRSSSPAEGRLRVGDGKLPWRMVIVGSAVMAAGFVFRTSVPTAGAVPPPAGAIVVGLAARARVPEPDTASDPTGDRPPLPPAP